MQPWVRRILGVLLLLAGTGLVAMTEQGLLDNRHASDRHGGPIVDLGEGSAAAQGHHGNLVRVSGPVRVVEEPGDLHGLCRRADAAPGQAPGPAG